MKLYGISGLGADERVFQYLNLDSEIIPLKWIKPKRNETIEDYAERFSMGIDTSEDFGIIGVSFGGLMAIELSKLLNPDLTILISSVETRADLRLIYRIIGRSKLLKIIPEKFFDPPRIIARWFFGANNKKLLNQILKETDLKFAKWAVNELVNWKNTESINNKTIIISGKNDKLLPPSKQEYLKLIPKGEHFMIVDRANEVSRIINDEFRDKNGKNH